MMLMPSRSLNPAIAAIRYEQQSVTRTWLLMYRSRCAMRVYRPCPSKKLVVPPPTVAETEELSLLQ
jgi:hypothetical protein